MQYAEIDDDFIFRELLLISKSYLFYFGDKMISIRFTSKTADIDARFYTEAQLK